MTALKTRLRRSLLAPALFVAACAPRSGYTHADFLGYRDFFDAMGFARAIEEKFLIDGDTMDFVIVDQDDKPIRRAAILMKRGARRKLIWSDRDGHLAFPVSTALAAADPKMWIYAPKNVKEYNMKAGLSGSCERGSRKSRAVDVRDRDMFRAFGTGKDRVYAEVGVSHEEADDAVALLAAERAALREILGTEPPPLGVALLASDDDLVRTSGDAEGRRVWTIGKRERRDDRKRITMIVHEWGHDIFAANRPGGDGGLDRGVRYLEEGFCELLAQLVYEKIRGTAVGSAADNRRKELEETAPSRPAPVDLVQLGIEHALSAPSGVYAYALGMCKHHQYWLGYGVGLAYWLQAMDAAPDIVPRVLKALAAGQFDFSKELATFIEDASGRNVSITVSEAVEVLRRRSQ